jgi:dUTP pyrophosphatase
MGATLSTSVVWRSRYAEGVASGPDAEAGAHSTGSDDDTDALTTVRFCVPTECPPGGEPTSRGSAKAAGYDVHSNLAVTLPPRSGWVAVGTGVKIAIDACLKGGPFERSPHFTLYAQIQSRSGMARNDGVVAFAGIIDADYRGEIVVLLKNESDNEFHVVRGDRIAQIVFKMAYLPELTPCADVAAEHPTVRGAGGFGSTGGAGPAIQPVEGA